MTVTGGPSGLGAAVGDITDSLVGDYDVVEIATRVVGHCAELLGAESVGLLVADSGDELRVLATSSEEAHVVEAFQAQDGTGPCVEAYRTGLPVNALGAQELEQRWPGFARVATREGIDSVHATPLRLRGSVVGSLNVFLGGRRVLGAEDLRLAAVLADLASLALSQAELVRGQSQTVRQLQQALDSRVVIEQAKGVLVATAGVDVGTAFSAMRSFARRSQRRLGDVALDLVERRLESAEVVPGTRTAASTRSS